MDPDQALADIKDILATMVDGADDHSAEETLGLMDELRPLVADLQDWIGKGGFTPAGWSDVVTQLSDLGRIGKSVS